MHENPTHGRGHDLAPISCRHRLLGPVLACGALSLSCPIAEAQTLVNLGGRVYSVTETRGNSQTGNHQQYTSAAVLRNGNVIVGWEGW